MQCLKTGSKLLVRGQRSGCGADYHRVGMNELLLHTPPASLTYAALGEGRGTEENVLHDSRYIKF